MPVFYQKSHIFQFWKLSSSILISFLSFFSLFSFLELHIVGEWASQINPNPFTPFFPFCSLYSLSFYSSSRWSPGGLSMGSLCCSFLLLRNSRLPFPYGGDGASSDSVHIIWSLLFYKVLYQLFFRIFSSRFLNVLHSSVSSSFFLFLCFSLCIVCVMLPLNVRHCGARHLLRKARPWKLVGRPVCWWVVGQACCLVASFGGDLGWAGFPLGRCWDCRSACLFSGAVQVLLRRLFLPLLWRLSSLAVGVLEAGLGKGAGEELLSFRSQNFTASSTANPVPHPFPAVLVCPSPSLPWGLSLEGRFFLAGVRDG